MRSWTASRRAGTSAGWACGRSRSPASRPSSATWGCGPPTIWPALARSRSGGASRGLIGATGTPPRQRGEALRFGFEHVGLDEIVSFTVPQNERSRRVMERIGLRHDPSSDFDHPRRRSSGEPGARAACVVSTRPRRVACPRRGERQPTVNQAPRRPRGERSRCQGVSSPTIRTATGPSGSALKPARSSTSLPPARTSTVSSLASTAPSTVAETSTATDSAAEPRGCRRGPGSASRSRRGIRAPHRRSHQPTRGAHHRRPPRPRGSRPHRRWRRG